jgi:hypothetical protein
MSRAGENLLAYGAGAVVYTAAQLLLPLVEPSAQEYNQSVLACEGQLYETERRGVALPTACQGFEDSTRHGEHVFPSITTTVTDSDGHILERSSVFDLPTAAEFHSEFFLTPDAVESQELIFFGLRQALGIAGGGLAVTVVKTRIAQRKRDKQWEEADHLDAQVAAEQSIQLH